MRLEYNHKNLYGKSRTQKYRDEQEQLVKSWPDCQIQEPGAHSSR